MTNKSKKICPECGHMAIQAFCSNTHQVNWHAHFYCLAKMRIDPLRDCYVLVSHLIPSRDYIHAGLKKQRAKSVPQLMRCKCADHNRQSSPLVAVLVLFACGVFTHSVVKSVFYV